MASNQAILNFLNQPPNLSPGKATQALSNTAIQRAAVRQNPSPQLKAQIGAQIDAKNAQAKAAQQQQKQVMQQQRIQLQAQNQALRGQKQAVDALQRQQSLEQRQQALNLRGAQEHRLETRATVRAVEGITNLADNAKDLGNRVEDWASNIKTPGGIGLLLLAIFILLWAVVPVNGGKTRAQLFWLTLTGRTRMTDTPDAGGTYTDPGATGASGNFGSGGVVSSNGHSVSAVSDLLAQASIRDWGSSV